MTVRLTGRLICSTPEETAIVARYLPAHIALTRAEPGCLDFEVTQSSDPLIWTLAERFASRAAFEAHQARSRASEWFEKTLHIKRDFEVTED